jgi:hypothetical protein
MEVAQQELGAFQAPLDATYGQEHGYSIQVELVRSMHAAVCDLVVQQKLPEIAIAEAEEKMHAWLSLADASRAWEMAVCLSTLGNLLRCWGFLSRKSTAAHCPWPDISDTVSKLPRHVMIHLLPYAVLPIFGCWWQFQSCRTGKHSDSRQLKPTEAAGEEPCTKTPSHPHCHKKEKDEKVT